jgi:acetyltransferase-like isoleucine patch superfamily enzyme
MKNIYKYISRIEIKSYQYFKDGKSIPISYYPFFFIKGLLNLIESLIRNISGPFGLIIRRFYYRLVFKKIGKDVLIDIGVVFSAPQNIACGNRVWFDTYSIINCPMSDVSIGNEVHIGPYCYLGGKKKITLKNFTALTTGSKIFSGSTNIPLKKNLILNPMIIKQPYENHCLNDAEVLLEENAVVLANCTIAPGVVMGKGSMLLPNSFLNKSTENYSIHVGVPAKPIATRL